MNCPKCSRSLPDGEAVCPDCDSPVTTPPPLPTEAAPAGKTNFVDDASSPDRHWVRLVGFYGAILVIGVICAIFLRLYLEPKPTPRNDLAAMNCVRDLSTCQEIFFVDHNIYTADLTVLLECANGAHCRPEEMRIIIHSASEREYSMQVGHMDSKYVYVFDTRDGREIRRIEKD